MGVKQYDKPFIFRLNAADNDKVKRIAKRVNKSPNLVIKALACAMLNRVDE